jgi:type II secretion system (T2SS) protein M
MRMPVLHLGSYRTVLAAGTALVFVAGAMRTVPVWVTWRIESRETAENLMVQLAERQAVVAQIQVTMDSAEARVARFRRIGDNLILARDVAEAATTLASEVGEAARNSLVRIDAIQTRADTAGRTALRRVVASVDATGDVTGLASMLQQLEQGPTFLAVRQLSVNAENVHTPGDGAENLRIRLTVEARALVSARP